MILGISGKKQSGKSTVGKIVQYLIAKYTVEDIVDIFKTPLPNYKYLPFTDETNWEIKQFASKLKEICSILTGIPVEDFEKEEVKSSYLGEEWWYYGFSGEFIPYLLHVSNSKEWKNVLIKPTIRQLLQKVGTDAMRDVIHPDVWINALMKDYINKPSLAVGVPNYQSNWIITDVRFPNEAKAIKDRQGIVIRVNRESPLIKIAAEGNVKAEEYVRTKFKEIETRSAHISETALDSYSFDYVIENSGTIEELIEKVKQMLIHFKLL